MSSSNERWPSVVRRGAVALLAGEDRAGTGNAPFVDDRWRRNNRALSAQRRGVSASDRREVLRTLAIAVLGVVLVTATALAAASLAPTVTGELFVIDEAGTVLDQGKGPADESRGSRPMAVPPS